MEFPRYGEHDQALIDPSWAFIEATYTETVEAPPNRQDDDWKLRLASVALADACVETFKDHFSDKALAPDMAETYMHLDDVSADDYTTSVAISSRLLRTTAGIVEQYDDPEQVIELRSQEHEQVIKALDALVTKFLEPGGPKTSIVAYNDVWGNLAHYTTLGLLTRLRHPRLLALSSLLHRDDHRSGFTSDNYDIIVLETRSAEATERRPDIDMDDQPIPNIQVRKVQVKAGCLGFCDVKERPIGSTLERSLDYARSYRSALQHKAAKRNSARSRYSDSISLVSGCCDMHMNKRSGSQKVPYAQLLVKEADGEASSAEVATLDTISNALLLAITGDPERRGTAIEPVVHQPKKPVANKQPATSSAPPDPKTWLVSQDRSRLQQRIDFDPRRFGIPDPTDPEE